MCVCVVGLRTVADNNELHGFGGERGQASKVWSRGCGVCCGVEVVLGRVWVWVGLGLGLPWWWLCSTVLCAMERPR